MENDRQVTFTAALTLGRPELHERGTLDELNDAVAELYEQGVPGTARLRLWDVGVEWTDADERAYNAAPAYEAPETYLGEGVTADYTVTRTEPITEDDVLMLAIQLAVETKAGWIAADGSDPEDYCDAGDYLDMHHDLAASLSLAVGDRDMWAGGLIADTSILQQADDFTRHARGLLEAAQ